MTHYIAPTDVTKEWSDNNIFHRRKHIEQGE